MLSLAERVYRTIQRNSLLPPDTRVIVALSGGADSTALACLLAELSARCGFRLAGVAHFNHRLRAASSDEDQQFCERLAGRLGVAWKVASADVQGAARRIGTSLEDAGRQLRYAFLQEAATDLGATHVAVGHTRDDQAETVLLQMLRGAGPRGLRGMPAARSLSRGAGSSDGALAADGLHTSAVRLVRPLLEIGHAELIGWLNASGIAFREDESNRDRRFLRNRIRHEVIPFLEERFSPAVTRVLARDASIAAADAEFLDALARAAFDRLSVVRAGRVELDREGLRAEPEAIARRVVLLALGNLRGARFVGFDQGDRLLALAAGGVRGPVSLPGGLAEVTTDTLVLTVSRGRKGRGGPSAPGMNFLRCELSIPGEAALAGTGWVVSSSLRSMAELGDSANFGRAGRRAVEAVVDAARVSGLAVRSRRPGDWLRPLGLGGRKKLQDYFVDRKVPREERDRVPLVVDHHDRIVWVAGHGIDEEFRVSGGTRDVVILKLRGESA